MPSKNSELISTTTDNGTQQITSEHRERAGGDEAERQTPKCMTDSV